MNTPSNTTPSRRELALVLAVALIAWCVGVPFRSLWGDEFHSMHHALTEDLGSFFASVRNDNHPPLSFLLQRISVGLFGLSDASMRLPSILVGIVYLLLLRRVTWRVRNATARRLAPWLIVASSFCFVIFTEARMYALLALAVLGMLEALSEALEGDEEGETRAERGSRWWLALWIAIGLHAHYYFIHELALASVLVAILVAATRSRERVRRALRLIAPAALGVALWIPWGVYGFRSQLTHDLPPGGGPGNLSTLAQSVGHLFFWNSSLGGDRFTRAVAWPGLIFAAIALGLGLVRTLASMLTTEESERTTRPVFASLLVGLGLGLPVWGWAASQVFERSTFGWRYVAGSAGPVLIIAAIGLATAPRARRVLGTLLFVTMGAVTTVNVFSGGHEDHRRLVDFILAHARPGDAVVTKPPWDPDPIPTETTWHYYLERADVPAGTPIPPAIGYYELAEARKHDRVWVYFRDTYYKWVRRNLSEAYAEEEVWEMGPGMTLHLFSESTLAR